MTEDAAVIDPLMEGLQSKGLKKGSISLIGAVAIGLAATAPAYSLTGALGHGVDEAGYQMPIVFILAVIPMYFIALAYKHLTDAAPDAGTVFTWGSKAILPHIGWIGGFALMLSSILAGVGAAGITVNAATVAFGIEDPPAWLKIVIAAVFILITTWLVARGAEESSRTTVILTVIQYGGLALFAAILGINILRQHRNPHRRGVLLAVVQPVRHHEFQRSARRLPGGGLHLLGLRRIPVDVGGDRGHRRSVRAQRSDGDHHHRDHLCGLQRRRTGLRRYRRQQPGQPHQRGQYRRHLLQPGARRGRSQGCADRGRDRRAVGVLGHLVDGDVDGAGPVVDGHLQGAAEPVRIRRRRSADPDVRDLVHRPDDPGDLRRPV